MTTGTETSDIDRRYVVDDEQETPNDGTAPGAGTYSVGGDGRSVLRIDCADCAHQSSNVCSDCLVTFLCEPEDDGAKVVPIGQIRAVRLLQDAGLAPRLRHRRRAVS